MKRLTKRGKRRLLVGCVALLAAGAVVFLLFWNGILQFNNPSREDYPVRGADVSHYQGLIDWETLAGQGLSFAFLKATEGSLYTDPFFSYNLRQARETDLRVGAYHFFSFDSPGLTQAEHYIDTVPHFDGMLPPVVDVEFYGDKADDPPRADAVRAQLNDLLDALETAYGVPPILYTTRECYERYIAGYFPENDLWFRSVYTAPHIPDNRDWTFWQYTNRETLDGYEGVERFIDLNVFNGTAEEFAVYGTT